MKCAWQELLSVLPLSIRQDVHRMGQDTMLELRLRLERNPEMICTRNRMMLHSKVTSQDLQFVINTASKYSPWLAQTLSQGYLTAPGGHRIGVCGEAIIKDGKMSGIRHITSVCIRVARDFPGMIRDRSLQTGSVLIIGKPGSGKTTFLRDLVRYRSDVGPGSVGVVDERGEIFPVAGKFPTGERTDVMTGCSKTDGMETLLRTMSPETIAVDEITSEMDCNGLLRAAWCGVTLIATAHAATKKDLFTRIVYKPLIREAIFDTLVILEKDKSWRVERMESA